MKDNTLFDINDTFELKLNSADHKKFVAVSSLTYTGASTFQGGLITLTPAGDTTLSTFVLENDYGWVSFDTNTGIATAQSTDLISGKFTLSITETSPDGVFTHTIDIKVYGDENNISLQSNTVALPREDLGQPIKTSNNFFNAQIPKSPTSTEWKWIFFVREKYGSTPMDVIIIDDELGTVTQQVQADPALGFEYNGGVDKLRSDEWKLYIHGPSSGGFYHISVFDPATNTFDWDAVTGMNAFSGQGAMAIDPTTRKLIVYGIGAGVGQLGEVNTATNVFTFLTTVGTSVTDPRGTSLAVGQDYIYTVLGRTPTSRLYQTTKDGITQTLIASTTDNLGDIVLTQLRWGVKATFTGVVGYTDGDYFLYNDTITAVVNPDIGPWTNQDGQPEFLGSEILVAAGTPYSSAGMGPIPSSGSSVIGVATDGVNNQYPVTVATFPYALSNLVQSSVDKMLLSARNYGGWSDYNFKTLTEYTNYDASASRIEVVKMPNDDIVSGGYPSQILFIKPANATDKTFIGYLGGDNGPTRGHYFQGFCIGSDGLVYGSGVQYRVGDAGTIGWFNPYDFDNTKGGFSNETYALLADYGMNNCVAMGTKIIISSYVVAASIATNSLIFVFDTATKTFTGTHILGTDTTNSGWIAKVSDTDIVGITSLPDPDKSLVIYRMNAVTGAIVYKRTFLSLRYLHAYNEHQAMFKPFELGKDGCIYTTCYSDNSLFYLIRIEPSIGAIEILGSISSEERLRLEDKTDDIYFGTDSGNLYRASNQSLPAIMPPSVLELQPEYLLSPTLDVLEWTLGLGWSHSLGTYVFDSAGGTGALSLSATLGKDRKYRMTIDTTSIVGTLLYREFTRILQYISAGGVTQIDVVMELEGGQLNFVTTLTTSAVLNAISIQELMPYVIAGNNILLNGGFAEGLKYWNIYDTASSVTNGVVHFSASANYYGVTNVFYTEVGKTWEVSALLKMEAGAGVLVRVYADAGFGTIIADSVTVTDTVNFQLVTFQFVATTTRPMLYLRSGAPVSSGFAKDVSVKEVI